MIKKMIIPFGLVMIAVFYVVNVSAITFSKDGADVSRNNCLNFTHTLYFGKTDKNTGGEVTRLQQYLRQFPNIYPEQSVTGIFGDATEFAVRRLQKKNKLTTPGLSCETGYGIVGKKTRAYLNKHNNCVDSAKIQKTHKKTTCVDSDYKCPSILHSLEYGNRDNDDMIRLQCFLSKQNLGYSAITGYFGPATRRAVQKWQARKGIVYSGGGYGRVGPATRRAIKSACNNDVVRHVEPIKNDKISKDISDRYSITISPTEGRSPLTVKLTLSINATTCTSYELGWGDGSYPAISRNRTAVSGCADTPISQYFTHTYTSPGTYTIALKNGNASISTLKNISESQIIVK